MSSGCSLPRTSWATAGAIIVSDAFILIAANHFGWRLSYGAMALLMGIGVGASLMAVEPLRAARAATTGSGARRL